MKNETHTQLVESHGDSPVTIRMLVEMAQWHGWSLDTPISFEPDPEVEEQWFVRGVRLIPSAHSKDVWMIELDALPEHEWERVEAASEAVME